MKILFFGDIFGRPGREGIKRVMPDLTQEFEPDFTIGNVENLAHGNGVTRRTLNELEELGSFSAYTSGNHIFDTPEAKDILQGAGTPVLRPLNYPASYPGEGARVITKGAQRILVVNLLGSVFMKEVLWDNAFTSLDELLERYTLDAKEEGKEYVNAIFVDFHAEATAEKRSFGLYLDGRVSAFIGTHTHVPTRDEQILPKGTAYITDAGMVGAMNSSIGLDTRGTIEELKTGTSQRKEVSEDSSVEIGAVVISIGKDGRAEDIQHVRRIVSIA